MKTENKTATRLQTLLLAAFAVLCVALNCFYLGSENFWLDEFMSIDMIQLPVGQMLAATAADVQPPLYYLIVRAFCTALGWSHFAYRLASFVPLLALAVLAVTLLRKAFGPLAAFLLLVYGFFGQQAQLHMAEVRMYDWLLLFVTMFGYGAYRVLQTAGEDKKPWLLLAVLGILVAYTHYFALVSVALLYLLLLAVLVARRGKKPLGRVLCPWCVCVGVSAAAYLPWLALLAGHLGSSVTHFALWDATSWHGSLEQIFGDTPLDYGMLVLCGLVLAATLLLGARRGFGAMHGFVLITTAAFLGTIALGKGFSALVRPIWVGRYAFALTGLVWLAFGAALSMLLRQLPSAALRGVVVLAVAGVALFGGCRCYTAHSELTKECTEQAQEAMEYVRQRVQPGDYLVTEGNRDFRDSVIQFYFPELTVVPYEEMDTWLDGTHNVFLFLKAEDPLPEAVAARMAAYGMFEDEYHSVRIGAVYPLLHQLRVPQP